jgi:hypothetical protein
MAKTCNIDMFQRTWYLPDNWWNTTSPKNEQEWRALINRKNSSYWETSKYTCTDFPYLPYLFLVNRPFTFGHSQLVMPIPPRLRSTKKNAEKNLKENLYFEFASIIIKRAIKGFEEALYKDKVHTRAQFHDLGERTFSYSSYIKTLIMRVSADEDPGKFYKVHLVPYFESNAALCQQRYCSIHKVSPEKRGGLIGWLGDKETEVEKWQTNNFELAKIARDIWKLPKLAIILRKKWPR